MRVIDADYVLSALDIFNDRENGNEHFLNGIETAVEVIENAPTVGDWISTKDRLPDEKSAYLVRLSDGVYRILYYCNYYGGELGWYETRQEMVTPFKIRNVTHWRLLPEPPKEVNVDA